MKLFILDGRSVNVTLVAKSLSSIFFSFTGFRLISGSSEYVMVSIKVIRNSNYVNGFKHNLKYKRINYCVNILLAVWNKLKDPRIEQFSSNR